MQIFEYEKKLVIEKIKSMSPFFKYSELKQNVPVPATKLRKILIILKNEGIIEKYSNRKWRRI